MSRPELTPDEQAWIKRQVDAAPELSESQRAVIASAFEEADDA